MNGKYELKKLLRKKRVNQIKGYLRGFKVVNDKKLCKAGGMY
jgi:hypothetical protein